MTDNFLVFYACKLLSLSEGVARSYMLTTDGKEITLDVHYRKEDETIEPFIGDYISYLDGSDSAIFCEALGDCVVYEADFSKLELFYESDIKYMKLARKISDTLLVSKCKGLRFFLLGVGFGSMGCYTSSTSSTLNNLYSTS